jgi:predicted membrane protein
VSSEDKFDGKKFAENLRERIHEDIANGMRRGRPGRRDGQLHRGGVLPGLILVFIGTVILLDHMGYIPADRLWRLWPLILIVVGAVKFFKERNHALGAVLMVIGGLFLSSNFGLIRLNWNDMWPLVLIGAGVALIWSRIEMPQLPQGVRSAPGSANSINEYAMFGGVERRISASSFTGGTVTALFGGVELDFRSADIEGEEAVIYVEAIFGGIEIVVPERWMVIYEGQSIFGGYSDETRPPLPDVPGAAPKKRLILRGRAVFGGISVKN